MNVFYTNWLVPKGSNGCARGPLILIRPERKGDEGLLEHERKHVAQWLRLASLTVPAALILVLWGDPSLMWLSLTPWMFHGAAYKVLRAYRLRCELEAYAEQARHYPDDRTEKFAGFISRNYGLSVTSSEAMVELKRRVGIAFATSPVG